MSGWIKIHRDIVEHWIWQDEKYFRWWMTILLSVNHETKTFPVNHELYTCNPGESFRSIIQWAELFHCSKPTVIKFFLLLKKDGMIETKTVGSGNRRKHLLTVMNWRKYQQVETQNFTETKPETLPKMTPNKNEKNKEKNIYTDFVEKFNQITGKKIRVADKKFKGQLNQRLKDGFSIDEILKAVENCKKDEFHCQNPQYLTPEFITRSDKLQKYLNSKEVIKQKPKLSI